MTRSMTKAILLCMMLALGQLPWAMSQDTPPGDEGASGASGASEGGNPGGSGGSNPGGLNDPTVSPPPPLDAPPPVDPPAASPPAAGAGATGTNATAAAPTDSPPVPAPAASPTGGAASSTGGATDATANPPAAGPASATAASPGAGVGDLNAPAVGPADGSQPALAPGPDTDEAPFNTTVSMMGDGVLPTDQQTEFCNVLLGSLSDYPDVTQCAVTDQSTSTVSNFDTNRRRLQQTRAQVPITIALVFNKASKAQISAIQNIINNVKFNLGSTQTSITVIFIDVIVQPNFVFPSPTTPVRPGTPTAPSGSRVTPLAPNAAPAPIASVITVVPANATGNTTRNVQASAAKPPATPPGGTSTTTTITNSTHVTTQTTIAVFIVNIQVTNISQYFFTYPINSNVGVWTVIVYTVNGNVANNLPRDITGGAATGRSSNITTTGATVRTVSTMAMSTSTTTTASTTANTNTASSTSTNTNTNTNNSNQNSDGRNVNQVCRVPSNPLGIHQVTASEGTLIKGAFLISTWANTAGTVGQGNRIYQCLPNGTVSIWAEINARGACAADNAGVGLTGALARCGSFVIAGSLPISGGRAFPGCLLALDTSGKLVSEVTNTGINGPWGLACTSSGTQITVAVSNVLGGLANRATSTGGRRLLQAPRLAPTLSPVLPTVPRVAPAVSPAARSPSSAPSGSNTGGSTGGSTTGGATNGGTITGGTPSGTSLSGGSSSNSSITGGFVVRWTFTAPQLNGTWNLGTPTYLVSNVQTNPASVATRDVGPGPLAIDGSGNLYIPDQLGNKVWRVPNGLTSAGTGQAVEVTGISSILRNPTGLFFGNNQLLGANARDGTLFTIAVNANGAAGTTSTNPVTSSVWALSTAVFSLDASAGAPLNSIWFPNAATNTLNTFTNGTSAAGTSGTAGGSTTGGGGTSSGGTTGGGGTSGGGTSGGGGTTPVGPRVAPAPGPARAATAPPPAAVPNRAPVPNPAPPVLPTVPVPSGARPSVAPTIG